MSHNTADMHPSQTTESNDVQYLYGEVEEGREADSEGTAYTALRGHRRKKSSSTCGIGVYVHRQ